MIKGSIVALITPFNPDGSVNYKKLEKLIEWHIENKTDALLVLGTTGESSTMSHEEDAAVCKFTVDVAKKRVPVIAGAGSNCTQTALEKSIQFEKEGADGLLLISPYYNKANAEGMYRHFAIVADAVHIPIIIYNVPGRTGCSIPEAVVEKLAAHKNIAGIKEASGNMSYAVKISRFVSDKFRLYNGNDDITVPMLSLGADAVISVLANICPRQTHDMVAAYQSGDHKTALAMQQKYLDLINALFCEVNPIPVKEAMNLMGMEVGPFRLPLCEMAPENKSRLRAAMEGVGLL